VFGARRRARARTRIRRPTQRYLSTESRCAIKTACTNPPYAGAAAGVSDYDIDLYGRRHSMKVVLLRRVAESWPCLQVAVAMPGIQSIWLHQLA
jgi:hypothetical protein